MRYLDNPKAERLREVYEGAYNIYREGHRNLWQNSALGRSYDMYQGLTTGVSEADSALGRINMDRLTVGHVGTDDEDLDQALKVWNDLPWTTENINNLTQVFGDDGATAKEVATVVRDTNSLLKDENTDANTKREAIANAVARVRKLLDSKKGSEHAAFKQIDIANSEDPFMIGGNASNNEFLEAIYDEASNLPSGDETGADVTTCGAGAGGAGAGAASNTAGENPQEKQHEYVPLFGPYPEKWKLRMTHKEQVEAANRLFPVVNPETAPAVSPETWEHSSKQLKSLAYGYVLQNSLMRNPTPDEALKYVMEEIKPILNYRKEQEAEQKSGVKEIQVGVETTNGAGRDRKVITLTGKTQSG